MHSRTTNHLSPAGEGGGKEGARIFFPRGSQGDQSSPTEVNGGGEDYVKLTANKGGIVRILCNLMGGSGKFIVTQPTSPAPPCPPHPPPPPPFTGPLPLRVAG